jgi:hypothetical protein
MSRRIDFKTLATAAVVSLIAAMTPAMAASASTPPTFAPGTSVDNPDGTHTVTLALAGDTWVSSLGTTASQTTSPELQVGSNSLGLTKSRSYLDFDYSALASIPANAVISSAQLTLSNFATGSCKGSAIRASRITGSWSLASLKWSAQPTTTITGSGTSTASYGAAACPQEGVATFDVRGIVSAWLGGSAKLGIQIKADSEGMATGYRKYRSAENGDSAKAPHLSITYDSRPDKVANLSVAPGNTNYSTSLTPAISATVSDPDGGQVSGYFEVRKGTTALSPIVWSGTSDPVDSGSAATVTVPEGVLLDNTIYSVVAWANDGSLKSTQPTATIFKVDVTAPEVAISSDVYTSGTWASSAPTASKFTFDGSSDTAGFYITTDGTEYAVGANTAGGDYTITWTPPAGWHDITAKAVDKAGNVGPEQSFSFGVGSPSFTAPTPWEGATADFPVLMTAPQGATGATFQWRGYGETTWRTATHVRDGETPWDGSVSNDNNHSATALLTWHATQEPFGAGTLHAPALIEVRGCFHYPSSADACTDTRYVQLVSAG